MGFIPYVPHSLVSSLINSSFHYTALNRFFSVEKKTAQSILFLVEGSSDNNRFTFTRDLLNYVRIDSDFSDKLVYRKVSRKQIVV